MGNKKKAAKPGNETSESIGLPRVRSAGRKQKLPDDKVIAILCSDIHLSDKAPIARSAEKDWYKVMARYLGQVRDLCNENYAPLIIAGDIFDRHGAPGKLNPSRLVNFAIEEFREFQHGVYAIPGQHDLPLHNLRDIEHSSYWSVAMAQGFNHLSINGCVLMGPLALRAFPWGCQVRPLDKPYPDKVNLAVVHSYVWVKDHGFKDAPEDARLGNWVDKLMGYDAAVFGDNHKGFKAHQFLNCGTLMRRRIDEKDYQPMVGKLRADGSIEKHYLDCSKDVFIEDELGKQYAALLENELDADGLISELGTLGAATMEFFDAVHEWLKSNNIPPLVKKLILKAMEEEVR